MGLLHNRTCSLLLLVSTLAPLVAFAQFSAVTTSNRSYKAGDTFEIQLNAAGSVNVTGEPAVEFIVNGEVRQALYSSGSGTKNLKFTYLVQAGDNSNGIQLTEAPNLNGGTLTFLSGAAAGLSYSKQTGLTTARLDTTAPAVSSVVLPAAATYFAGQLLSFTVNFSEPVLVSGAPALGFQLGAQYRQATYLSGSGTSALVFQYAVAQDDLSTDGLVIGAQLALNGGQLTDAALNAAHLALPASSSVAIIVAGTSAQVLSISAPEERTYNQGEALDFVFNFDRPVVATGTPTVIANVGGVLYPFRYHAGSGTSQLTYRLVIFGGMNTTTGLRFSGVHNFTQGSLEALGGHPVRPNYTATTFPRHNVSSVAPALLSAQATGSHPAAGYKLGDAVDFLVTFNEAVSVTTGSSRLKLTVGGATRYALYHAGSGTTQLTYRWVVSGNSFDSTGLEITSPLNLNGDALSNGGGVAPSIAVPNAGATTVKVDAIRPLITGVELPANATYLTGQHIDFRVSFSKPVVASGTPRVALTTDQGTRWATVAAGENTTTLTFRYTVGPSDNSPKGISYPQLLNTELGTVTDAAGNLFSGFLATTATIPAPGVVMFGDSPFIMAVTPPAGRTYVIGEHFDFSVEFSREVQVVGNPSLTINLFGVNRPALYHSGSGSKTLTFRYQVISGYSAPQGVRVMNAFGVDADNRIEALTGGAVNLTLTARTYINVLVDAPAPHILAVTYVGPQPPALGFPVLSELEFEVLFSEPIVADKNSSRLRLNLNGRNQFATMISGSGTNLFRYRYRVPADVVDPDGIEMVSPLGLSGSILLNGHGIAPALTFTPPNLSHIKVMAALPYLLSNTVPAPRDYRTGEALLFTMTYPRPVFVTGVPQLNLFVGPLLLPESRWADYLSGSGTDTLTFRYVVQAGDTSPVGVTLFNKIYPTEGATIVDEYGNSAAVGGVGFLIPNVTMAGISVNAAAGISEVTTPLAGTYKTGQHLDFVVKFGNSVNVTGFPALSLDVGGQSAQALYLSHTGGDVTFRYTVPSGAADANGIGLSSPIDLNGGSIQELNGIGPSLAFPIPDTSGVRVDGIDVTVASLTVPASATYAAGQHLDFSVTFSHPVAVTGTPTLTLEVGGVARQASYQSGAGTSTLLFRYTVQASDSDFDGITLSSPVVGDIRDSFGDLATLSFSAPSTSGVLVSGAAPAIASVTPPANGKYGAGQNLNFIVNTTHAVNVTGTPRLTLTVGSTTRYATYVSGSGTSALTFSYQVQAGEFDSNGITMTGIVTLNGGTIRNPANVNMSPLTFTAPTMTSVLVDAIDLVLLSVSSPANGTYGVNGQLNFVAGFNYPATVTGTPRIQLTIGATTRYATYVSGSGTTNLTFRYTIVAGEADANGIDSVGGAIQLNGGSISDPFGDAGTLTFSTGNLAGVLVDAVPPTVASMTVSAPKTYILNDQIVFTATYSEPVTVSGTPRLNLTIGSAVRYANYVSGSGTSTLTFAYVVGLNDVDTNGIASTTTVESNGGSISDLAGNAQTNFNYTRPSYTGVNVDGNIPVVSSITAPTSGTRGAGATIAYRLNFNQATTVVGSPRLQLRVGSQLREAVYSSGSGTTAITFNYLTVLGDNDSDGVEVVSPLVIPSGASMKDVNGNDAQLSFTGVTHTAVLINTSNPNISNVVVPASNTYRNGLRATMDFTLQFNSNITVTGTPRLVLNVGGETVYAPYSAGTGTPKIRFRYSVLANHLDLDGVEFASNTIDLNGGVMRDAQMNNAELDFSIPDTSGLIVVLASMQSWYDASDSSKVVLNTDGNLTTLQDKIGSTHLTAIGTIPFEETGFNERSFGFITCTPTSYLHWNSNLATPRAVIAAFRAPASAGAEYLFQAGSRTLHFSSTANNGTTATGVNGAQFVGSDWTASTATQTNAWTPGQAQVRAYSWSSTQNTRHDYCKMNGELAEFFRFNAVPSAADVQKIEEYLSNKYDLFLPQ